MSYSLTQRKRIRNSFGKYSSNFNLPDLIEIQKNSYELFLQANIKPEARKDRGLQNVFKSVFPVEDLAGTATLEFVKYDFGRPKYNVTECIQRGLTYSAPLKATLRLIVWDKNEEAGTREVMGIKEQEVYMSDLPLMTDNGTFIVNGTERVVVSQMHRSPGVFFDHDGGTTHASGKVLFSARIIPYRGSWMDFEFDAKDLLYFRIDRKRKIYISSLLRALGMDNKEIVQTYFKSITAVKTAKGWAIDFVPENYSGDLEFDLIDAASGEIVVSKGTKLTPRKSKKFKEDGLEKVIISDDLLTRKYSAEDLVDAKTGEIILAAGTSITSEALEKIAKAGTKAIELVDNAAFSKPYILDSLSADKNQNREDALFDIYRVLRPGEPPTIEASEGLFKSLFFSGERYDLSDVGRVKMNARLGLNISDEVTILTKEDIVEIVRKIVEIRDGKGEIDDIDHLGNRRVRSVGELVENQMRIGLLRVEKAILERIGAVEIDTVMPNDIINSKPLAASLKEFFGLSQLSQFMDQTNPLSEVTHKRRLSALGPGGLTRERAGFEVRDVHPTHYGRICPIETPEGPNIGLINSLSTYARVNKYGFIETPYAKVVDGKLTTEINYLSAIEEGKFVIAQADAKIDGKGKYTEELVSCRKSGDFIMIKPSDIQYADVSPKQLVSVAASLIPFLENDDANRALMGSNMMRQAVPLLKSDAPLVGTGMEAPVAFDSGAVIVAKRDGIVDKVDATRIVIKVTDKKTDTFSVDIYNLRKFQRTNQNTCINQKPIVKTGDAVKKGDIIADGPSTDLGELALGKNVIAAFMPWNGYNFEDSILISERIVKDDVYTSIHIEEFESVARDTKLGAEEITRDIPNVSDENLVNIDETGIVHIGAEVGPGDILVGKVTPKSESPMTPEEKLLRAIFGEKAADVKDSSLRMKPGISGTVVDVRVFSRRGVEKDERTMEIERAEIERLKADRNDEYKIITAPIFDRLTKLLAGQKASKPVAPIKKGDKIEKAKLSEIPNVKLFTLEVDDAGVMSKVKELKDEYDSTVKQLEEKLNERIEKLQSGDDLPSGVLKVVKVYVAVKRKLQPGDKMAGRHGNKGVVSKICPAEDMPFLEDGTPVDVVLNPLGVPSRMNIGQIFETHLGWASYTLGKQIGEMVNEYQNSKGKGKISDIRDKIADNYSSNDDISEIKAMNDNEVIELAGNLTKGVPFATPVFDGAKEQDISDKLKSAGISTSGQFNLFDGRTGEKFDRKVTVGIIYILKLHHLVDDKLHARSIGPYSLVTQQPLGGKSHFGGQRFGEMECWALQAYGAAYTLQEMLTIKSDDVVGRTRVYESIVKGNHSFEAGVPESFNVMVKELRSLCLNVELKQKEE
ncbi:MAG TPA: DNA-directed RNA polymerase subunit beta [Alphaproteobacteria bacterium]|nr:DNA-directed RNA polymerase subunit beta [Alphaproteobacteria bacterium]